MNENRRKQLEYRNQIPPITEREYALGFHYCHEWDGLLIGPEDPEFDACLCYKNKEDLQQNARKLKPGETND